MDFHPFGTAVHARYSQMAAAGELYVVDMGEEDLFAHYLGKFPPGTDPIYKTNTEHNCSCCKHFIRHLGRLVSIENGKVRSVWPTEGLEEPYLTVSQAMNEVVLSRPIDGIFRSKEHGYGAEVSRQLLPDKTVKRWEHFHGKVAAKHRTDSPDEAKGRFQQTLQVFQRGLLELAPAALTQVIELIESNALYRGEEHLDAVKKFHATQTAYLSLHSAQERMLFVLVRAEDPATRFRNSVIGTLVQDLGEGVELEKAVRSFEAKVAPTNYKRTTALITPRMVAEAMKTVRELGLEPALERRLARISDISVNNVLWVDRSVKAKMKGGVEDLLLAHEKERAPATLADRTVPISIDALLSTVLPKAISVELFLKNSHMNHFMTLTAPVQENAQRLFKWDNDFAWSYDGNITDTIREKVKAAGGNVDAKLRFSLAWFNYDDLDVHVKLPNDMHVFFGNKAGILDVDMNAAHGAQSRQPVENLSFNNPEDGRYEVWVNQYNRRETGDVGFAIEVASNGQVQQLSHKAAVMQGANIPVGRFWVSRGVITQVELGASMTGEGIPVDKWGLKTEKWQKVETVLLSPNYWDGNAVGNRHTFFILQGCRVDGPARGIYNEFLASGLEKHRKVFEVLGDKTKCPPTDEQLSGVGFSSTRGDEVLVAVQVDARQHLFTVKF